MAFCRIVYLLVVSVIFTGECVENSGTVPVFLWGDVAKASLKSNPLKSLNFEEFESLLSEELQSDPFTVVFIEETLSVEDFSRKNSDGFSSYPYLHSNIGKAVYLPSVEAALSTITNLAPEEVDNVKLTENGLSAEIEPGSSKYLFISLKDAKEEESRAEMLHRHDEFMQNMFDKLKKKYNNVVALYTAQNPSWTMAETYSRVRRQLETQSGTSFVFDKLLLYVSSIEVTDGANKITLGNVDSHTSNLNNAELSVMLAFQGNNALTLHFKEAAGYWYFSHINMTDDKQVTEVLEPTTEVFAVTGFSYRCAQSVVFSSVNATNFFSVAFHDIKVQPFFSTAANATNQEFGDSFNCVGFFTAPIWAGLFVTAILLFITFSGIMMMMDIRTMDRFDDPKGKTITINTSE